MRMLRMSQQKDLEQTDLFPTETESLSQADSHVRTSQSPGIKKESQPSVLDFGQNSTDLLASYDQTTQSWRMSQLCLVGEMEGGLAEYSETWPKSGAMRDGISYKQQTWAHHTEEIESGLWPTPAAHEGRLGYQRRDTGKKGTQKSLTTVVVELEGGRNKTTGQLNPTWVEWLMGFPIGWTDLKDSATQ